MTNQTDWQEFARKVVNNEPLDISLEAIVGAREQPTTAPTTFEPDWEKIATVASEASGGYHELFPYEIKAGITEYHRQMAESGKVTVDRQDLALVLPYAAHLIDLEPYNDEPRTLPGRVGRAAQRLQAALGR